MKLSFRFCLCAAGTLAGCLIPALSASAQAAKPQKTPARPNILFLAVDDLRPALGCYGDALAKTPNIDRLAGSGTTFLRAYCQQAVCSPSRTSLLTGLRPDGTRIYDLTTHFRTTIPDVVTLPQYFKQNGYFAQAMGKINHPGLEDNPSWSVPPWKPKNPDYGPQGTAIEQARHDAKTAETPPKRGLPARGPAFEAPEVADNTLRDGATADYAIETLGQLKTKTQPFFLAVGFAKPHLPFVAPKKYWDLFKPTDFKLPANYRAIPTDIPPIAMTNWAEMRAYDQMPPANPPGGPLNGPVTDAQGLQLIHGYYASTAYMDAQVGRVLNELDRLKLRENTVVVLWSDHGYQLGEHTLWAKHTNFEIATRVPLLLSVPNQKARGAKVSQLAELVDVYPTLCEAAGLPIPANLAGKSLLAVAGNAKAPTKAATFSQYPRGNPMETMGYSMRTDRYRYTEWISLADGTSKGTELYDHQLDTNENQNLANRPENKALIATLSRQLRAATPPAASPPAARGRAGNSATPNAGARGNRGQGRKNNQGQGQAQPAGELIEP